MTILSTPHSTNVICFRSLLVKFLPNKISYSTSFSAYITFIHPIVVQRGGLLAVISQFLEYAAMKGLKEMSDKKCDRICSRLNHNWKYKRADLGTIHMIDRCHSSSFLTIVLIQS